MVGLVHSEQVGQPIGVAVVGHSIGVAVVGLVTTADGTWEQVGYIQKCLS